jgi:hypothetical protein
MTVRVSLREIIDGMQLQSDEMSAYLNIETGQVVPVSAEDLMAAEFGETDAAGADWEIEAAEIARAVAAGKDYVALPDRFEIDEYRMMERFANGMTDAWANQRLERAIQGRGAFRRFKDAVQDLGLAQQWYEYRDRAYEAIAIDWCDANGIAYTKDEAPPEADA